MPWRSRSFLRACEAGSYFDRCGHPLAAGSPCDDSDAVVFRCDLLELRSERPGRVSIQQGDVGEVLGFLVQARFRTIQIQPKDLSDHLEDGSRQPEIGHVCNLQRWGQDGGDKKD
jgi:hypothetical protein